MMEIHDFEKQYHSALKRVENCKISDKNKELILRFVDDVALENVARPRLIKYLTVMRVIAEALGKDLDKVQVDDLKKFVSSVQQRDDYSPWTKKMYKVGLRRFYKWLKGTKDYPEIVSWISISMSKSQRRLPSSEDLLNEGDIKKLISAANHPRNKAFVAVLWESGARIGEIGNLHLKNVIFDKYGVQISVQGKTGERKVRLIFSTPYLSTWVNNHPFKDDKHAPLWINIGTMNHNKIMKYRNMRKMLMVLSEKTGITKRINPHTFRHSRATFMANHLTEFQMNQYFGWIQGSDMPSTYVHMSGKEVDSAILKMNGFEVDDTEKETMLIPQKCIKCDTLNNYDSKHCSKCGGILDLKYAMEKDEQEKKAGDVMAQLLKDKDVQALLMEKLKVLG